MKANESETLECRLFTADCFHTSSFFNGESLLHSASRRITVSIVQGSALRELLDQSLSPRVVDEAV